MKQNEICSKETEELTFDRHTKLLNEAKAFHKLKHYKKAIHTCTKALILNPESIEALFIKALSFKSMGNIEKALFSYDKAIEIQPNNDKLHYNKAKIRLYHLKEYNEAAIILKTVIKLNPKHSQAHYDLGYTISQLSNTSNNIKYFEMAKCFKAALKIKPYEIKYIKAMATIYQEIDDKKSTYNLSQHVYDLDLQQTKVCDEILKETLLHQEANACAILGESYDL